MADDVPVPANSGKTEENNDQVTEEDVPKKKINITVKTPKEKETFEVEEDLTIKEVSTLYMHFAVH